MESLCSLTGPGPSLQTATTAGGSRVSGSVQVLLLSGPTWGSRCGKALGSREPKQVSKTLKPSPKPYALPRPPNYPLIYLKYPPLKTIRALSRGTGRGSGKG